MVVFVSVVVIEGFVVLEVVGAEGTKQRRETKTAGEAVKD